MKPRSGTTALLRYDLDMPSGYARDTEVLRQGFALVSQFLARQGSAGTK